MQISYFGLSSFKITTKDYTSVTDPFSKDSGLTPPRGAADLLILSEKDNELYSATSGFSGQPFLIDGPGEYDVKSHTVDGIPIKDKATGKTIAVYLIEVEGIKILNLTHIKKLELTQDEVEDIGEVDILIVPVGGGEVMDYDEAAKTVNLIDPKIVIPSCYKFNGVKEDLQTEEKFLKQMGNKFESMDKLSLKKKDLGEDDNTKVIVLQPLR